MSLHTQLQEAYKTAKNYPDLVKKFIELGIKSYTVEVSSSIIIYRMAEGNILVHVNEIPIRSINSQFNKEQTIQAVRNNQQGKTDYPGFMNEISQAGVYIYEATLVGKKIVTYIGRGGNYQESIPEV